MNEPNSTLAIDVCICNGVIISMISGARNAYERARALALGVKLIQHKTQTNFDVTFN